MSANDRPWGSPPSGSGNNSCMVCQKPTRSHALGVVEAENGEFTPSPERGAEDFIFPVCHTCYEEYDGDAETVCTVVNNERNKADFTPGAISATDVKQILEGVDATRDDDPERGARGQDAVKRMVENEVEPGDILHINEGDEPWAVIPVDSTEMEKVQADIVYPVVMVSESADADNGGGIVRSRNPMDDAIYHAYLDETHEEIEFEPLEQIDVIAHSERMEDGV